MFSPPERNRTDADTRLICFHDTGQGPKSPPQKTDLLPVRTRTFATPFSNIVMSQAEAGYEEIDAVPAIALGLKSEFGAGQWHVVHPITYWQVRDMSNNVLLDIKEWIEETCPNELFTRDARHVLHFKAARDESVDEIRKELERRKIVGDVGREPGYTGDWKVVDDDVSKNEHSDGSEDEETSMNKPTHIPRHSEAGLEAAREAGRKAAEDVEDQQEWDFMD